MERERTWENSKHFSALFMLADSLSCLAVCMFSLLPSAAGDSSEQISIRSTSATCVKRKRKMDEYRLKL